MFNYRARAGILIRAIASRFKDVIVTSSAVTLQGRFPPPGCGHLAIWTSPFNWAALNDERRIPTIFVVESNG